MGRNYGLSGNELVEFVGCAILHDNAIAEKLLACIDIYQALTESRPYKDGFSHEKTIAIMNEMVEKNQLDKKIVEDLDKLLVA